MKLKIPGTHTQKLRFRASGTGPINLHFLASTTGSCRQIFQKFVVNDSHMVIFKNIFPCMFLFHRLVVKEYQ